MTCSFNDTSPAVKIVRACQVVSFLLRFRLTAPGFEQLRASDLILSHVRICWAASYNVYTSFTSCNVRQFRTRFGDGVWLFPRLRELWDNVRPFIPRLRFFFSFLCKWRLARAHLLHSLGQDQSTVAQRAKTTGTKFNCLSNGKFVEQPCATLRALPYWQKVALGQLQTALNSLPYEMFGSFSQHLNFSYVTQC